MHESSVVTESAENSLALAGRRECMRPVRKVEKCINCNRQRRSNYFEHSEAPQTKGNARKALVRVREIVCIPSQ